MDSTEELITRIQEILDDLEADAAGRPDEVAQKANTIAGWVVERIASMGEFPDYEQVKGLADRTRRAYQLAGQGFPSGSPEREGTNLSAEYWELRAATAEMQSAAIRESPVPWATMLDVEAGRRDLSGNKPSRARPRPMNLAGKTPSTAETDRPGGKDLSDSSFSFKQTVGSQPDDLPGAAMLVDEKTLKRLKRSGGS